MIIGVRIFPRVSVYVFWGMTTAFLFLGCISMVQACRIDNSKVSSSDILRQHVVGSCSLEGRTALALPAKSLLEALKAGKSLDLQGVVVTGDVMLEQLPRQPIDQGTLPSQEVRRMLNQRGVKELRIIPGSLIIRDSIFQGNLATNLRDGALVILGGIDMSGTAFQKSVDFSRTIFLGPSNFSEVTIQFEGFFINSYFTQDATFSKTSFGTHTRFHKAYFGGKVKFDHATFNGIAELLEVIVEKDAGFLRTSFMMGTGFSGALFRGPVNFSHSMFEREGYFRFTTFERTATFSGARFREIVDFTNANFHDSSDFSGVLFEKLPDFSGTDVDIQNQQFGVFQDQRVQWGLWTVFLVFFLFFLWRLRHR